MSWQQNPDILPELLKAILEKAQAEQPQYQWIKTEAAQYRPRRIPKARPERVEAPKPWRAME